MQRGEVTSEVTRQERARIHPSRSYILSRGPPHLLGCQKNGSAASVRRTETLDYFSSGPQMFRYHVFGLPNHPLRGLRQVISRKYL